MSFNFYHDIANLKNVFGEKVVIHVSTILYSYSELINASITLSIWMHQFYRKEAVCAVISEKTFALYQGMLACFFSGFIYMPINIDAPLERNRTMLRIANPSLFFIGKIRLDVLMDLLSNLYNKTIVISDYDLYVAVKYSDKKNHILYFPVNYHASVDSEIDRILTRFNENNIAYLFFTSGSTGVPKGVPISYKNLNAYLYSMQSLFRFDKEDGFIQMSDIAFDISIHEIIVCFLSGATLYVYDNHRELSIARFIDHHKITQCFLVPSSMHTIIKQCHYFQCDLSSLKTTLVCGESFPISFAQSWTAVAPNTIIANLYGPTEATIACTAHIYQKNNDYKNLLTVPIGFAFPTAQLKVTPDNELLISGEQVFRGYWAQHDFLITCLHATGDLVSWDAQFGYIFLGRKDDQWQIKGYRVEKIEIESILRIVCNTDEIYVVPNRDKNGLVNFVIACSVQSVVLSDYLNALLRFLPESAIPKKVIQIACVPTLSNGKVNYRELQKIGDAQCSIIA